VTVQILEIDGRITAEYVDAADLADYTAGQVVVGVEEDD